MRYDLDNLVEQYDRNESLDFLFFWGHTAKGEANVGKHIFIQWYLAPFTVVGITYLTTEHWMMAQKACIISSSIKVNHPQLTLLPIHMIQFILTFTTIAYYLYSLRHTA